ncbi:MAG: hypothetical protein JXR96_30805 [Deltaproteobacteria bacterium]|nr:hypothetical protein [Deltaproteobacteria bacterium]
MHAAKSSSWLAALVLLCAACGSEEEKCGNARLDEGEYCDTGVSSGEWMCPVEESCMDFDPCTEDRLVGEGCQARCENTPITEAIGGDGCCPDGVDPDQDSDCGNVCERAMGLYMTWIDDFCQQHQSCCFCECFEQDKNVASVDPCSCEAREPMGECSGDLLEQSQACMADQVECRNDLIELLNMVCSSE